MTVKTTLMWFRQDLRRRDNPALRDAYEQGKILPIYIFDDTQTGKTAMGAASKWWLHHSLNALNESLNGHLHIFKGDPETIIPEILEKTGIQRVVWNRCYEPWQIKRDKAIKTHLKENDIEALSFNGSLLWEPWQVLKKDQTPYKVFTPYYRKGCLQQPEPRMPQSAPDRITYAKDYDDCLTLDELSLLPDIHWYKTMEQCWKPGEEGAADNLSVFLKDALEGYKDERNIPSVVGTSRLSPHLHFGEISPNQIWYAALDAKQGNTDNEHLDTFLSELGWREFSHYLLFHWPRLQTHNFNDKYNDFPWQQSKANLRAWQQGQTGIPIVDAGMRELWQTGYMHNRVRMIVGSFLVKNLLIDWREGERWFWDCLVDADMAANSASWQWVAGCGADAAPYFRIFNPVLQGEKFDTEGEYVSRYCPELKHMPKKYIHKPWEAPKEVRQKAQVVIGNTYPAPIVDLKASRQRALDAYDKIK
ncbi:DNA photolyase family protein [Aestuariibacter sp. AA17]|uniref:DNA photolyase family protein n=1 Tax=Fluctibacter corallii TaxID=2984329 RepID=A0ABT3A4A0_9ALTE|nr:deoxyribodipyrimidine photo-lyase [Aestuariibacter sp. AA17]MCV2883359.1 DNA photolyase family protein [Aestuariibacter sp. AA17]